MPWEIDGRRWHTVARVGRTGNPCRWDGRILAEVVDRIEEQADLFSETDWNSRSVVEIRAAKKSDGWFFHAITGEEWLLKMKFRTARNTFQRDELVRAAGPEAAERHARSAALRHRAAGAVQEPPRPVAGDRAARARLRGDRPPGVLGVRRSRRWPASASSPSKVQAVIRRSCSPGSNWAARGTSPAAVSRRQEGPVGRQRCWRTCSSCWRRSRRRAVPLEQQAGRADLPARAARALGGRADEEARRRLSAPDGPQGPLHAWDRSPSWATIPSWTAAGRTWTLSG